MKMLIDKSFSKNSGKIKYKEKLQKRKKVHSENLIFRAENKNIPLLLLLLIAIITFIVYAKSINYGFIYNWDDAGYILKNDYIKSLSLKSIKDIFTSFHMHNYHPLTTLTYAVEYSIVKENASLYHFNNILLHIINAFLVFVLIKKILKQNVLPALLVSSLFALHPMHVESVAWISQRKDLLYTLFFLLALISYVKYLETRKINDFFLTVLFFIASCLSKSAAIALPVLLFAFDYFFKRNFSPKVILEKIPLIFISLIFGFTAVSSQDTAIQDLKPMLTYFDRFLIVCQAIWLYLAKTLYPDNLSAFHPYPLKFNDMLPSVYYYAPILVLVFFAFIWYSKKWGRSVIFGAAFFFITISLVLQIIPVGAAIIAERYTYVPYIGLFFILTFPLHGLNKQVSENIRIKLKSYSLLLLMTIIVFAFLSFNRVGYWKNGDILFSDVIKKYPQCSYAYNNRGFLYFDYYALLKYKDNEIKKNAYVEKAYKDYSTAIKLNPKYTGAYLNRAVLLYNTGRPKEALSDFNMLIELAPHNLDGLIGRGNTLSTLEMYEEAIPDYNTYISLKQDNPKAYLWRGIAYCKTGVHENAISDFETYINMAVNDYEGYYWKGISLYNTGSYDESLKFFKKALELKPDNYEIYSWRGLAYYKIKDFNSAIQDFSKAIQHRPYELSNYINRSRAYYETGNYEQAYSDLIYAAENRFPIDKQYYEKLLKKVTQRK